MKRLKKGSTTVEAMLVMQVVIIVIFIIFRMCIVQYQNIVISTQAMGIATKVGYYWDNLDNERVTVFDTSKNQDEISAKDWINNASFMEHNPYQSVAEWVGMDEEKEKKLKEYASEITGKEAYIINGKDIAIKDNGTGTVGIGRKGVFESYVMVTITRKSVNPLTDLFGKIGFYEDENYTITAKGIQTDTAEFARTVSMIRDFFAGELVREPKKKE